MRVLIADDSELIVQRLTTMLAEIDSIETVGQAGSVAATSQAIRELKPDIVILDIAMPGGSGMDVLKGLKRDHLTPVVIVLTNHGYPQYRKKCLLNGARFFFDKSSEFDRVGELLRSLPCDAAGGSGSDQHDPN